VHANYAYDPLGRRIEKFGAGVTTTYFLSDGADEIAEYDRNKALTVRYVPGPAIDEPVAVVTGNAAPYTHRYFHTDRQGSVIAMSDDSGAKVEGPYVYDPYGNCFSGGSARSSSGEPYRFTGRRLDPETGLYYYRARYYWPQGGRFLSTDPVGYAADLNLYTYVGNDPTDKTGPSGMDTISLGWNYAVAVPTWDANGNLSSVGLTAELGIAVSFPGFTGGDWDIGGYGTHGTAAGVGITFGPTLSGSGGSVSDLSTHGQMQSQLVGAIGAIGASLGTDVAGSIDTKLLSPRSLKSIAKSLLKGEHPKIGDKGEGFFAGVTTTKTGVISARGVLAPSSSSSSSSNGSGRSPLFGQTVRMQGTRICPKDSSGQQQNSC
jgi:RHS repeat-associated protein